MPEHLSKRNSFSLRYRLETGPWQEITLPPGTTLIGRGAEAGVQQILAMRNSGRRRSVV